MSLYSIRMSELDRLLESQNGEIGGYTIGKDFRIRDPNLAQCKRLTRGGGIFSRIRKLLIGPDKKSLDISHRCTPPRDEELDAPAIKSKPTDITSVEMPIKVADKPEMIGLDGIMIIIVDLHGGLDLPLQPINPDSFTTTNLASIAAAPPGLSNIVLPGFTREMHQDYIDIGLKKRIEQNLQNNLQIIEGPVIEDIAAANQPPLTKKQHTALENKRKVEQKKMSLVSPDLFVLMLDDLRQSVKESFAESFTKWGKVPTKDLRTQAALANPEERYRSLNIIKGFGVDPDVASLPYKKYVSYHDKNDKSTKMGVTTMTFRINKNNKVTCGKKFTSADKFMSLIKYHEQPDPAGGTIYSATMEELIKHFIRNAKKTPETIVMMDLTCSVCRDGRVLKKPLDEYSGRKPGGGNKKTKKTKKTKNKRRTYR
jgi:hypothetical protein